MPEIAEWQQAIDDAVFDLQLDPNDEAYLGGAVPVRLLQQGTSFEFWMGEVAEMVEAYPEAGAYADKIEADAVATFVVGSELEELYAALIAASTMAKFSNGIFFDPQESVFLSGADAVAYARSAMSEEEDEDEFDDEFEDESENEEFEESHDATQAEPKKPALEKPEPKKRKAKG